MKAICTLDNFNKALNNCERITSKQNTLKILNNILIKTEKNRLTLSATNLEMGIYCIVNSKIEEEGDITIPSKTISSFITNLPKDNNIELNSNKSDLKIKTKNSKAIIKGMSSEDFPLIPRKNSEYILKIKSEIFKKIINKTVNCIAFNDVRVELTGVNCRFFENKIHFAATDSFRLVEYKVSIEKENINKDVYDNLINQSVIIPSQTLLELGRIIQNSEDDLVSIFIEDNQIFFEINNTLLVSRLIDGKYPEYEHIIPKNHNTSVVIEKESFKKMIKVSSVFSDNKNQEIRLKISPKDDLLVIEGRSVEFGENTSEIKIEARGLNMEIVLNAKYLIEGLNNIETNEVGMFFNDSFSPVTIKQVNSQKNNNRDDFIYIIMPIKKV